MSARHADDAQSTHPPKAAAGASPEELFREQLPTIERILASVCRRHAASDEEAEEFGSWARLKLIEDDYAVLAKFQGRSRLTTYLTTVLVNLFRDFRIQRWGKWRPSAAARRLGTTAVLLERLTSRDGFSFEEAARHLRDNHAVDRTDAELAELAAELPHRTRRYHEGEEALEGLPGEARTSGRVEAAERDELARRIEGTLATALAGLGEEDRVLLRLHFREGLTLARIARLLGVRQKPLYRRKNRLQGRLATALEAQGIGRDEVAELLRSPDVELELDY